MPDRERWSRAAGPTRRPRWRAGGAVLVGVAIGVLVGVNLGRDRDGGVRSRGEAPAVAPASTDAPVLSPGQPGSAWAGSGAVVTVYGYSDSAAEAGVGTAHEGTVYGVVDAQVCAQAAPFRFDPGFLSLVVPQGTSVVRDSPTREPALATGEIPAHQCVRGYVTYRLPAGVRPVGVRFDDGAHAQTWLVR